MGVPQLAGARLHAFACVAGFLAGASTPLEAARLQGGCNQLLAATFATVAIAAPVLLVSTFVETYASPHLIRALVDA